ncbi:MAG: TolC family protein [Salinivirgaceae bacterium]|nr:TolC family protein [Salinivirgaceae bacterium]
MNYKLLNISIFSRVVYKIITYTITIVKHLIMILLKPLKYFLLAIVILLGSNIYAQTITLKACHDSAEVNFPLVNQKEKLVKINALKLQNIGINYLPSLNLNAKATYQSDVTELPDLPFSGLSMPSPPNDQYAATIDITQLIYDGGAIKAAKNITELSSQVELQKIEVDIYKVKEQINLLYLTTLLIQENKKILNLTKETVSAQKTALESAVNNGVINVSELDNLDAELLKLDQQIIEVSSQKKQLIDAVSELSGITINEDSNFEIPTIKTQAASSFYRPEHILFENQAKVLDASMLATQKKRMPTMAAFGSFGYGNPGMNMFNQEWDSYYMVGAQLKWNIWDWKKTNREMQQLGLQKEIISDNVDAFNQNLSISENEAQLREQKLNKLLEKDNEIVLIRKKISNRTALQMKNGTKTSADFIQDLNAEKQASINLKSREIQIIQAQIDQLSITGKTLFNH